LPKRSIPEARRGVVSVVLPSFVASYDTIQENYGAQAWV
jgi:hypothetical protein